MIMMGFPKIVGEVISKDLDVHSWDAGSALNDFSFSNGSINLSGTNTTLYDKYIFYWKKYLNLRNFTIDFQITVKDISAGSNGIGIGIKSFNNTATLTSIIEVTFKNGVLEIYKTLLGFGASKTLLGTGIACAINDVIKISWLSNHGVTTYTVINATTGAKATYNNSDSYPNTGRLAIYSLGGVHQVNSVTYSSEYSATPDILFIGDSITNQDSFAMAANRLNYRASCAGSGDKINEVNLALSLNKSLFEPRIVHILIGTNDQAQGSSTTVVTNAIVALRNSWLEKTPNVYIGKFLPKTGNDMRPYNTALDAAIPSTHLIDYFTDLVAANGIDINTAYSSDGVHPNSAGTIIMSNKLIQKLGL